MKIRTQASYTDFIVIFLIRHQEKPVMFLGVKLGSALSLRNRSSRRGADHQMRSRLRDYIEPVEIDQLYGISALGTNLCIYTDESKLAVSCRRQSLTTQI